MLLLIRGFLVFYGIVALATGIWANLEPYDGVMAPFADNSRRFVAAIWASMALGFFYAAWKPDQTGLFRFLLVALLIGGVARTIALLHYPPEPAILGAMFIELVPPPILWLLQAKLMKSGRIG